MRESTYSFSSPVSAWAWAGMPCHFMRHFLQHEAVACWAMNAGWLRIGVCFPSLGGSAGARRSPMKTRACSMTVPMPFSLRYRSSFPRNLKRERNSDFFNLSSTLSMSFNRLLPSALLYTGGNNLVRRYPITRCCLIIIRMEAIGLTHG